MIWIGPGTFLMSSTHGAGDDTQVTLTRGYWPGRTEVIAGAVAGRDWSASPSPDFSGSTGPWTESGGPRCWFLRATYRARAYGRPACPKVMATPVRRSKRSGSTRAAPGRPESTPARSRRWRPVRGQQRRPDPPGRSEASQRVGACDMHGNVWEWCADLVPRLPGRQRERPSGPASGHSRVVRGVL